jgi:hypothetical protein
LSHEGIQRSTALGAHVPLAKSWGNPASRQSEYETPPHPEADETITADVSLFHQPLDFLVEVFGLGDIASGMRPSWPCSAITFNVMRRKAAQRSHRRTITSSSPCSLFRPDR